MRTCLILLLVALASCTPKANLEPLLTGMGLTPLKEPSTAPSLNLSSAEGAKIELTALRGQVVVVNFWATWCGPCKQEWPSMVALNKSLAESKDIVVLAVDVGEPLGTVKAFLDENSANFTVLLDTTGGTGNAWGVQGLPTTAVIDKQGRLVAAHTGGADWSRPEIVEGLKKLAALP